MDDEIQNIRDLLQRTFEKNAWHGPAVKEVLENITAEQSNSRLQGSHSIVELVAHMTAWRTFVVKKLEGDTEYKVSEEINFPVGVDWSAAKAELDRSQRRLLAAIKEFDGHQITRSCPS